MAPKPAIRKDPAAAGNFRQGNRTAANIDSIVLHTPEGSAGATVSWFKNPASGVSAHYVITQSGEIIEMVAPKDIAFAQTYYNNRAIGIECEGFSARADTWTSAMLDALADLTAWLCDEYGVEPAQADGSATGPGQFNGTGIVAHGQIQPWDRTDPGPHFPWTDFTTDVRARLNVPEPDPAMDEPEPEPKIYTVQSGDSLWKIALEQLGAGAKWPRIANLNGISDPLSLRVGQKLILPH